MVPGREGHSPPHPPANTSEGRLSIPQGYCSDPQRCSNCHRGDCRASKESFGGNGQCCISGEQWEEARAEITTQQQEQCNASLEVAGAEIVNQEVYTTSCDQIAKLRPELPSGYYMITTMSDSAVQVYCDMTRECCNSTGGWTRVAYLNMSDTTHTLRDQRGRACGRNILDSGGYYETVTLLTYSAHEMEYSCVWTDQRISRQ